MVLLVLLGRRNIKKINGLSRAEHERKVEQKLHLVLLQTSKLCRM